MAIVVDANTIALYKFNDDPAGTGYATAVDSSGNARNLSESGNAAGTSTNLTHIINGPAGAVAGKYARWFPGELGGGGTGQNSGAHLRVAASAAWTALFLGSFSVATWIRVDETPTTDRNIVIYASPGETLATNNLFGCNVGTNRKLYVGWENGAGVNVIVTPVTLPALTVGVWYHFAVTVDYSGATVTTKYYLNGTLYDTITGSAKAAGGTSNLFLQVGSLDDGTTTPLTTRFLGALKSLHFSTGLRTAEEIAVDAARTTYEHVADGSTFALYQFDEEPDAIDETSYGYHLRKTAGSIWRVDPLYPDEGYSAFFDTATEYDGHWGYSTFITALTSGVWTFDAWIRLNANYNSVERGFWVWAGSSASETQANNILRVGIDTSRRISILEEYGAGTNAFYVGATAMFTAQEAYNRHHFAVVHDGLTITTYIDGVQVDTGSNTHLLDGATSAWLQLGSSTSVLMSCSMDNARFRNIAATEADILATFNDGGGSTPNYDPDAAGARRSTRWGVK